VSTKTLTRKRKETKTVRLPQYNVILLDDNDHTYDYVIEMLVQLFNHSPIVAYKMACEVDSTGRVIVDTTHKERAELKRDQILAFGPDWRLSRSQGSMRAILKPVEIDK
jgi:ATP-dependent Clp protease adaptor protein ClpS